MQNNLPNNNVDSIAFEISEEVRNKMRQAETLHALIDEQNVHDLRYVDVSDNKYHHFKRAMDIFLSLVGLLVLFVPGIIVMVAVFIDDPGKPFFRQYRVGRGGKRFRLLKFRTMRLDTPKYLSTMEVGNPDQYITRIGRFLRRSSLDEIPQLINVLKGDMSLVGPRPLISDEYEIHEMRTRFGVYNVRPGITGLAQINGRDTVSPVEKVHWDVKYIENFGFLMDLKILFATVPKVFGREGVVEGYSIEKERHEAE